MKYFNPSYWFKLWLLSAPLFNDKTQGINAKSIDNKNIKDWASNNTTNISLIENQELNLLNNQTIQLQNDENIQSIKNLETDHFYENFLKTQDWSRDPQIAQQQLQEIEEEHHQFLKEQHKRYKRQPNENNIFRTTINLIVSDNPFIFFNRLHQIIAELSAQNPNIITTIQTDNQNNNQNNYYFMNPNSRYNYFSINVIIGTRNLRLFYRSSDLYLQGFVSSDNNLYRYFSDSDLRYVNSNNIINNNNSNLNFRGNYDSLNQRNAYSWQTIINDFQIFSNSNSNNEQIRNSAIGVILSTSESMRFNEVEWSLLQSQDNFQIIYSSTGRDRGNEPSSITNQQPIIRNWDFFSNIIRNWGTFTGYAQQYFSSGGNLNDWYYYSFLGGRGSIIRIFTALMGTNIQQCQRRNKRDTNKKICYTNNSTSLKEITYFLDKNKELYSIPYNSSEIKKVNIDGKITAVKILDENTQGGNLKAGTIYVGTENGVYLIYPEGEVHPFDNLNFPIKDIILDGKGSAYVINDKCEIYHLDLYGWGSKKERMESCDLKKELKLYYRNDKSGDIISNGWYNGRKTGIHDTFNLGKIINPINYKKIEFFGFNFFGTKITWGNTNYFSCKPNKYEWSEIDNSYECSVDQRTTLVTALNNKNKFTDIVTFVKINEYDKDLIRKKAEYLVHDLPETSWGGASIEGKQYFGLAWFYENENFYLQFLYDQWATCHKSTNDGLIIMNIGNGIRLYNDDNTLETQILNPNDRKRRDIISNTTKWTDDLSKDINHEQHLPIVNKTNFVTNNITSL